MPAATPRLEAPTLADVRAARDRIRPYLAETPFRNYPVLDELLGFRAYLKHENHLPTCAFKVRGGLNLLSQLPDAERRRGVIAASTGNHGQSVAYAAKTFGVRAIIGVPEGANPGKVAAMKALGAEVVFHGKDFDEARGYVEARAAKEGLRYVHSGNEPHLIAGVGTHTLEMLEAQPDLDAILVPVGGGSGAAGCCIAAKGLSRKTRVIGVQSEAAPAAYKSWKAKRLVEDRCTTFAEGLATRTAFDLPQRILWEHLDDFVLVSDDEIKHAILVLLERAHTLAEGAGAASLAAALRLRGELKGKTVGLVVSGGNISMEQLRDVVSMGAARTVPAA